MAVMTNISCIKNCIKRKTGTNHRASKPVPTVCAFVLPTDGNQPLLVGRILPRILVPGPKFWLGFSILLDIIFRR